MRYNVLQGIAWPHAICSAPAQISQVTQQYLTRDPTAKRPGMSFSVGNIYITGNLHQIGKPDGESDSSI